MNVFRNLNNLSSFIMKQISGSYISHYNRKYILKLLVSRYKNRNVGNRLRCLDSWIFCRKNFSAAIIQEAFNHQRLDALNQMMLLLTSFTFSQYLEI